jgi:hypothetical protein
MSVTWDALPLASSRMCLLPSFVGVSYGCQPAAERSRPGPPREDLAIVGYALTVGNRPKLGNRDRSHPSYSGPRQLLLWSAMVVSSAPMHALATRVSISLGTF